MAVCLDPCYSNMRRKRTADPFPAQASFKPCISPPPPNPIFLLLWTRQHSLYSSLCINVIREIAAYMTPFYFAGLYRKRLFIVNMDTCKTYFPKISLPSVGKFKFFQCKRKVFFIERREVTMLDLPSLVVTKLPLCSSFGTYNVFFHLRLYSECLYCYMKSWTQRTSSIQRLHLKTGQWSALIKGLDFEVDIRSEVVYKDWWVFFLLNGVTEWFSFEKGCFREPAIQLALPDFTIMGEVAEGELVCIGYKCQVYKVDIEKQTVETRRGLKYPWDSPTSSASLVQGDILFWLDIWAFELRSINFKTMVKSTRRLFDNL